ncbi:AraC family transcriptional regulator [Enterococcus sp. AZ196]|uniref:AraC family transcriptional regulator n=1 Tax=Enterococcus sp. AZ196 TaxID=2774659 RepID=UPI003D298793
MPIFFQITSANLPISIGSIGNHWEQESIVRKEGYPHFHWLQTEEGYGDISIDNRLLRLEKGEGVLIKPFTPHTYLSNKGWLTKFVTFNGTLSDEFSKIVGGKNYILGKDSTFFNYSSWIDDIIDTHLTGGRKQINLSVSCYEFLMNLNQTRQYEFTEDQIYKKYVLPTITTIENQFELPLTLEELASNLFVTPQYLSRVFKKYTNETIFSYLQKVRLNKSKELLINHSHLKIQEITALCGFSDTSYFISLFKKLTGYTPLQFRKLYLIRK